MATKGQKASPSKLPATQTVKTYTFKVSLPSHRDCWRKIEIKSDQTLQMLHRAILDAYDFDDDHLYSFFMSNKAWDKKTEYSLPEGTNPFPFDEDGKEADEIDWQAEEKVIQQALNEELREITGKSNQKRKLYEEALEVFYNTKRSRWREFLEEWSPKLGVDSGNLLLEMSRLIYFKELLEELRHEMTSDVRKVTIEDLNLRVNKKFMYLFDYGDEWRFQVQVASINKTVPDSDDFPRVTETFGEAPRQYPYGDDDFLEFEEGDEFEDE